MIPEIVTITELTCCVLSSNNKILASGMLSLSWTVLFTWKNWKQWVQIELKSCLLTTFSTEGSFQFGAKKAQGKPSRHTLTGMCQENTGSYLKEHQLAELRGNGTHSSSLAWKIPWTEEPGRLQSMGSLRVGHDWVTSLSLFTFMHWERK